MGALVPAGIGGSVSPAVFLSVRIGPGGGGLERGTFGAGFSQASVRGSAGGDVPNLDVVCPLDANQLEGVLHGAGGAGQEKAASVS